MKNLSKLFIAVALLFSHSVFAQEPEMADVMRSNGKIYVVVAIIMVVFTGLIVYLTVMDRKITRLEKNFPRNKPDNQGFMDGLISFFDVTLRFEKAFSSV